MWDITCVVKSHVEQDFPCGKFIYEHILYLEYMESYSFYHGGMFSTSV